MKKYQFLTILTGTMLTIAAGTGCGTPTSQITTETTSETATTAANPESEATVIKPLYSLKTAQDALADGGYSVSFTADDLVKNENGYDLTVEVYGYDRYEKESIDHLAVGSQIQFCGKDITIEDVEKDSETGYITLNGGVENGGIELTEEDGLYRTVTFDNHPVYYSVGKVAIPLSEDVTFEDQADSNQESEVPVVDLAGLSDAIKNSETSFTCNDTVITVRGGQIVQIIRYWIP